MKKTKLVAGFLSIAMATSMLPIMPMTASAEGEYAGYLFYADFDDSTSSDYSTYDAAVEAVLTTRTTVSNVTMSDIAVTDNQFVVTASGTGKQIFTNGSLSNTSFPWDSTAKYEYSYTINFDKLSAAYWGTGPNILTMQIGGDSACFRPAQMTYTSAGKIKVAGEEIDITSIEGAVTVKSIIDNSAGTATTYVTYSGLEEPITINETSSATISNWKVLKMSSKFGVNGTTSNTIVFDNIYLKKVTETSVTIDTGSTGVELDDAVLCEGVLSGLPTEVAGYTMDGYFYDAEYTQPVDVNDVTDGTTTIYLKLISTGASVYTVNVYKNGGGDDETLSMEACEYMPEEPTREGYTFAGWYTDADCTVEYTGTISGNTDIYAAWVAIPRYTITFNYLKDGIENTTAVTNDDMEVTLPSMTTDDGYRILGWYADEALTIPFDGTNISADGVVYAQWTNKKFYADFSTSTGNNAYFAITDTTGHWTGGIVDGRMAYTRNNDGTKATAMNANSLVERWSGLETGRTYEYGYTVDFNGLKFPFSWSGLAYRLADSYVNSYRIGSLSLDVDGNVKVQGNLIENIDNITGDIDVKVIFSSITGENNANNAVVTGSYTHKTDGVQKIGPYYLDLNNSSSLVSTSTGHLFRFDNFADSATTGDYGTIYFDDIYYGLSDTEGVAVEVVKGAETETLYAYEGYVLGLSSPTVGDGEKFIGWYTDDTYETEFTNGNVVEGDKIYAKIESGVAVNFVKKVDGAEDEVLETVTAVDGVVTLPEAIPSNLPYSLDYWYYIDSDGNEVKFDANNVPMDMGALNVYTAWTLVYMSEDFEGDSYDAEFDTPTVTEDTQRWTNKVVTDENGNKYMEYTLDTTKTYDTTNRPTVFSVDMSKYTLDLNTRYELGYKFAMSDISEDGTELNARLGDYFALEFDSIGNANATATVATWNVPLDVKYYSDMTFTNDVTVPKADVDGFVTVKYYFNLNRDAAILTGDDATINVGTAEIYISYVSKTTGETVVQKLELPDFAISKLAVTDSRVQAGKYLFDSLTSFKVSEPSSSSGNGFKLLVDDVYLQVASASTEGTVTFDTTDIPDMPTPEPVATVDGYVTLPEVTDDVLPVGKAFAGWYTEDGARFVNNGEVTSDITLYARTIDIKKVYVYFSEDTLAAGEAMATLSTTTNAVEMPEEPTNAPYFFENWYVVEDGVITDTVFDPENVTALETVVVAVWEDSYFNITFDSSEDEGVEPFLYSSEYWTSAIAGDENNKYVEYTYQALGATQLFNDNTRRTKINKDADYEYSYKFDIDSNAFLSGLSLTLIGSTGALGLGRWNTTKNTTNIYFAGGTDEYGEDKNITIDTTKVDGFITVKYHFNIGNPSAEDTNTGNAIVYVTYFNNELNKQVSDKVYINNFETYTEAGGERVNLMGLSMNVGDNVEPIEGSVVRIDDVYLAVQPEAKVVSFNSNGGTEVANVEADPNGDVTIPEAPTKDGVAFAGWFRDSALTTPFDGTMVFEDMTVYARWQTAPVAADVEVEPADGKITLKPTMVVKFDTELNSETINKTTVKFLKDGIAFDSTSYNVSYSIDPITRNSIVTVSLNTTLDYAAEYTLLVSKDVTNAAGAMDEDVTKTFTTPKLSLVTSDWSVTNAETGDAITSIEGTSNKTINISFKFGLAN